METTSKLQLALQILCYLSGSFGYSLNEIMEKFNLSERTAYRYIQAIRESGFIIEKLNGYYRVNKNEGEGRTLSELLHFSEEEAWILSKAIHSIDDSVGIKNNLVKKLYSLYDFGRVAHALIKKEYSENIHVIIEAMKSKRQVLFKDYSSANSESVSDRLVEPVAFTVNFISVWCFEPASMENKLFKTSRIGEAELGCNSWQFEQKHREGRVDVFRMSSFNNLPVKLRLSLRARNLLCEEYPLAEKYISNGIGNSYMFETEVCSYEGIGRFVIGLAGEIEVLETIEFRDYLNERIQKIKFEKE